MKTHAASRRLLSFALSLAIVFCLIPAAGPPSLAEGAQAPVISTDPTAESTYAQNAAARFYVRASSPDKDEEGTGWLSYQWYASAPFDSKQENRDAVLGTALANGDTIGNSAMSSALTVTTPAIAGTGTRYVYYWAEITNHFGDDANTNTNMIKSAVAEAKIVDRTLEPQLMNGDFEGLRQYFPVSSYSGAQTFAWNANYIPALYWNTTEYANHTGTDYVNNWHMSDFQSKVGATTNKGDYWRAIETGTKSHSAFTPDNPDAAADNIGAELSALQNSSLYQNIATVPGKIYEWSLDHARNAGNASLYDTMAVVIGSAVIEKSDYGDYLDKSGTPLQNLFVENAQTRGGLYEYGQNSDTLFTKIVEQATGKTKGGQITAAAASDGTYDKSYTTTYMGKQWYVYLCASNAWTSYKGSYTVPAGQGASVFAFVSLGSVAPSAGNQLDNIAFASGSDLVPAQDVAYTGETSISAPVKAGFAYALAEVRGSSVINLYGLSAWHDGEGISPSPGLGGEGMWYTGMDGGEIAFRDLTPGKTYRIIGIPEGAINEGLHTNLYPNEVLDDGYYRDVRMMSVPVEIDVDTTLPSAAAGLAEDGKAFITAENTRGDTQYALLRQGNSPDTSSGGAVAGWRVSDGSPEEAVADWLPGGGTLQFDDLERGKEYYLVTRPYGYIEIDYEAAAYNDDGSLAAQVLRTPAEGVVDLTAEQVARPREDGGSDAIAISFGAVQEGYICAVGDLSTGYIAGPTQTVPTGGGIVFFGGLEPGKVYQAVTRADQQDSWMKGVRAFTCAEELAPDYQRERLRLASDSEAGNRFVPAGTEYIIRAAGGGYLLGSDSVWLKGSGSGYINLADGSLDAGGTAGASVFDALDLTGAAIGEAVYRRADAGYVGEAVYPALSLEFPARRPAPSIASGGGPGDYRIDYANEPESLVAESALEHRAGATGAWTPLATGSSVDLAALGWTGAQRGVYLRSPATDSDFPSAITAQAIAGRPDPPSGIGVAVAPDKMTFSNLDTDKAYQYRVHGAASWVSAPTGSAIIEITEDITADYDLRFAAAQDTPASRAVTVSSPISLAPVVFEAAYGQASASAPLAITNYMADEISGITLAIEGVEPVGDYFELDGADSPIAVGGNSTDSTTVTISPKGILGVGIYTAEISASYSLDGGYTTKTAVADLQFSVAKAEWDMSGLTGVTLSGLTALGFTAEIQGGAPEGAILSWQAGDMEYDPDGAAVESGGAASKAFTGLAPQTAYPVHVVALGDANHHESEPKSLITAYTAMPEPAALSVVRIDYGEERLVFNAGYSPADYIVRIDGVSAPAIEGRIGLSGHADGTGTFAVSVTRRAAASADGQGIHPESSPSGFELNCRAAAPAAYPPPASTELSKDGRIEFGPSSVQYRKAGSGDMGWQDAGSNAPALGLGVGTYEVRVPPTATAFASHIATGITIGASSQTVRVLGVAQLGGSDGTAATTDLIITLDRPVAGFDSLPGAVTLSGAAISGAIKHHGAAAVSGGYEAWSVPINQIAVPNGGQVTLRVATGAAWQPGETSYVIEPTDADVYPDNIFPVTVYAPVPFGRPEARIDYVGETFAGLDTAAAYEVGTVSGSLTHYIKGDDGSYRIHSDWHGKTVYLARSGDASHVTSTEQAIDIPQLPSAPPESGFAVTAPTAVAPSGGAIAWTGAGDAAALEWRKTSAPTTVWQAWGSVPPMGLAAGNYEARYKAVAELRDGNEAITVAGSFASLVTPVYIRYEDNISFEPRLQGYPAVTGKAIGLGGGDAFIETSPPAISGPDADSFVLTGSALAGYTLAPKPGLAPYQPSLASTGTAISHRTYEATLTVPYMPSGESEAQELTHHITFTVLPKAEFVDAAGEGPDTRYPVVASSSAVQDGLTDRLTLNFRYPIELDLSHIAIGGAALKDTNVALTANGDKTSYTLGVLPATRAITSTDPVQYMISAKTGDDITVQIALDSDKYPAQIEAQGGKEYILGPDDIDPNDANPPTPPVYTHDDIAVPRAIAEARAVNTVFEGYGTNYIQFTVSKDAGFYPIHPDDLEVYDYRRDGVDDSEDPDDNDLSDEDMPVKLSDDHVSTSDITMIYRVDADMGYTYRVYLNAGQDSAATLTIPAYNLSIPVEGGIKGGASFANVAYALSPDGFFYLSDVTGYQVGLPQLGMNGAIYAGAYTLYTDQQLPKDGKTLKEPDPTTVAAVYVNGERLPETLYEAIGDRESDRNFNGVLDPNYPRLENQLQIVLKEGWTHAAGENRIDVLFANGYLMQCAVDVANLATSYGLEIEGGGSRLQSESQGAYSPAARYLKDAHVAVAASGPPADHSEWAFHHWEQSLKNESGEGYESPTTLSDITESFTYLMPERDVRLRAVYLPRPATPNAGIDYETEELTGLDIGAYDRAH
ncbi:MAG: hypothetical protein LBS32_02480, partial [Clostridiales Family XIII bacterium]|nr:hypothetical protein [Clostridiales Family XIII bacterium]